MSDVTQRLLAALEALERTLEHASDCNVNGVPGEYHLIRGECSCDYDVRRRLAIAQRIKVAIETASAETYPHYGSVPAIAAAVAAFASPGRDT